MRWTAVTKHDEKIILVLSLLILAIVSYYPTETIPSVWRAYGATQNMLLSGDTIEGVPRWNGTTHNANPTVTVTEGDSVSVSMRSTDGTNHQLYVDVDKSYPRIVYAPPDKYSAVFQSPIVYNFTADFPAGKYVYYCSLHPFTMYGTFNVRGFTLTSNPNILTITRGKSASSTVNLTSFNGFTGTASLVATSNPIGPIVSFNPSSFNLPADGTATSAMSASIPPTTPPGHYNVSVRATVGNTNHTAIVTLDVKKPGFSLTPNPSMLIIVQGSSKTTNLTVSSLNTFNGTVTLASATSLPAGISLAFNPPKVTLTSGESTASILNVTVGLSVLSRDYNLTINGVSGSETNSTVLTVTTGQDFTISVSPSSLILSEASSANSTLTVTSVNGFFGNITLSSSASGLTVSFNASIISLLSGATEHVLVTVSAASSTTPGNYIVTISGTNGTRTRSLVARIALSGFTMQASQAFLIVTQGMKIASRISLTSLNGFSGTINLAIGGNAYTSDWSLTQSTATLGSGSSINVTATFATTTNTGLIAPGTYFFNITGASGPIMHWTAVAVTVLLPSPAPAPSTTPIAFIAGSASAVAFVAGLTLYNARRRVRKKAAITPKTT